MKAQFCLPEILRKILLILLVLLVPILIIEAVVAFFVLPKMMITEIRLEGSESIKEDQLFKLIKSLSGGLFYYQTLPRKLEKKLESFPMIRKARVEKKFPHKMRIVIEERQPLLAFLVEKGGHTISAFLDEEGVYYLSSKTDPSLDLPFLSGLKIEKIEKEGRIPPKYTLFLSDLAMLKKNNPLSYNMLSELEIRPLAGGDYELVLYPMFSRIRVLLGKRLGPAPLKRFAIVLDFLKKNEDDSKVRELDFRANRVVYTMEGVL